MKTVHTENRQNNFVIKNSINYLSEVSKSDAIVNVIKSLCRTKLVILQRQQGCESTHNEKPKRCPRCLLDETEVRGFHEIAPMKLKPFDRKIIKKNKENKPLSRFQRNHLKKLEKKFPKATDGNHNLLVITCGMCNYKESTCLRKPNKKKTVEEQQTDQDVVKKRKKKKKADKCCGLNKKIVESCQKLKNTTDSAITSNKSNSKRNISLTNKKDKLVHKNSQIQNKSIDKQTKNRNRGKEKQAMKKHLAALSQILEKSRKKSNKELTLLNQFLTAL